MFYGRELLIIHGISLEYWAKKYGVEPFEVECDNCGKIKKANLPARSKTHVGLRSAPCPCGDDSVAPYAIVMNDSDWGR